MTTLYAMIREIFGKHNPTMYTIVQKTASGYIKLLQTELEPCYYVTDNVGELIQSHFDTFLLLHKYKHCKLYIAKVKVAQDLSYEKITSENIHQKYYSYVVIDTVYDNILPIEIVENEMYNKLMTVIACMDVDLKTLDYMNENDTISYNGVIDNMFYGNNLDLLRWCCENGFIHMSYNGVMELIKNGTPDVFEFVIDNKIKVASKNTDNIVYDIVFYIIKHPERTFVFEWLMKNDIGIHFKICYCKTYEALVDHAIIHKDKEILDRLNEMT